MAFCGFCTNAVLLDGHICDACDEVVAGLPRNVPLIEPERPKVVQR